ncbi:MAG: hypothetical protein H6710_15640 [Myxococcales bacterium]|nr:hypothetical protein [Myxococcales bacterium]
MPVEDREGWLDRVFGIDGLADDGPELPPGCVPYLPCSVDTLLRTIEHAEIRPDDVFVDVGSGLGRAAMLTHLLTGAGSIGVEIQPHLVSASMDLSRRLNVSRCPVIAGDASEVIRYLMNGTVFFLYCPFSGERVARLLDDLEPIARTRPLRICCVDLLLPPRSWLTQVSLPFSDLAIYQSHAHDERLRRPRPQRPRR